MNELAKINETIFENIKHIDNDGNEYWYARELQQILGYKEWRYFSAVIEKAQIACSQSNNNINSHFGVNTKIVSAGKATKPIIDYRLSRYACYLIVQNANPKYEAVSLGQTYFAVQTRKMELTEEEYGRLTEDEKRLYRRRQTRDGNKILYKIAKEKDVQKVYLNGENVTTKIRSKEVSKIVSQVSSIKEVRFKMVDLQRRLAEGKDVIMEGRDIGTYVFPNANVKIYLDATAEERAKRRYLQNQEAKIEMEYDEILQNIKMRDKNDMEKEIGALKKAPDAVYIDSSNLSITQVKDKIIEIIKEKK